MWKVKAVVTALVLSLVVVACNVAQEPIVPQKNGIEEGTVVFLPSIDWYILSERDLRELYVKNGMSLREGDKLHGFAGKMGGRDVIFTTAPKSVDDEVTLTLGHEVMHVAYGAYHEEN